MMKKNNFFKCLAVATIVAICAGGCGGGNKNDGTQTEKSTKSVSDKADLTFDGFAYAPNILSDKKVFKKADYKDWTGGNKNYFHPAFEDKSYHERIILVDEKISDTEWRCGAIVDGYMTIDPYEHKYTSIKALNYAPGLAYMASYVNNERLCGFISLITGEEILPCKYADMWYDPDAKNIKATLTDGSKTSFWLDGSSTGAFIDPQGNAVPFEPKDYEAYQDGDKWGVKVDGKNKFPANKYNFLSLEKVPGMTWHFVCRSKMDNGEIKCGIVSFAFNVPAIVVRRIYDDYEFLGKNGNYASNSVRFYDATHKKNTSPLVLNCNGEEAGIKAPKDIYEWGIITNIIYRHGEKYARDMFGNEKVDWAKRTKY